MTIKLRRPISGRTLSRSSPLPALVGARVSPQAPQPLKWKRSDILTPKQTAEYLGLSEKTLANRRSKGAVPGTAPLVYTKIGGRVRYRFEDILDFVRANRRENTSQMGGVDEIEIEL